jgi:putative inorganic carbon (hco3(-)) transporter
MKQTIRGDHQFLFYLICMTLFLIPLFPQKTYVGFFPLSLEVVLIPFITVVFLYQRVRGKITVNNFPIKRFIIFVALYSLVIILSLLKAESLLAGLLESMRFWSYIVLFLIVAKVKFSEKQFKMFGYIFLVSMFIAVSYGVLQYIFNFSLNKAGMYAMRDAIGRVGSTFINPNYYGGFLNFLVPGVLLFAVIYFKKKSTQLVLLSFFSLAVINVVLTYTRASWLILFMIILLTIAYSYKAFFQHAKKAHIVITFLVLAIVVYNLPDVKLRTSSAILAFKGIAGIESNHVAKEKPDDSDIDVPISDIDSETFIVTSEITTMFEERDTSLEPFGQLKPARLEYVATTGEWYLVKTWKGNAWIIPNYHKPSFKEETTNKAVTSRITLWKTGWMMFKENPILGVGQGNYMVRYKEYVTKYPELDFGVDAYSVHNSYLKIMAETGVLGIVSFLAIYVYLLLGLLKGMFMKSNHHLTRLLSAALVLGGITFMLQNVTNNLFFIPQINVLFWLVVGLIINVIYSYNEKKSI